MINWNMSRLYMFLLFLLLACGKSQYSSTIVNSYNSEFLNDRKNKIWKFLVEEKYLLDSAMHYLPPSSDTTYVFLERNWCHEKACLAYNSKNHVYFLQKIMTKDSFKLKSTHFENRLPKRDYYEIRQRAIQFDKAYNQSVFYNRDTIQVIVNPPYCALFNEHTLTYWLDSAQNLHYKIYRIKLINNKRVNLPILPGDSLVSKFKTSKKRRIRFK